MKRENLITIALLLPLGLSLYMVKFDILLTVAPLIFAVIIIARIFQSFTIHKGNANPPSPSVKEKKQCKTD